jgi:membrane-bound lytic murein transglycosylase B
LLRVLFALAAVLAGAAPPEPNERLPVTPAAIATDLGQTAAGLRAAIADWQRSDPALVAPAAPRPVELWALRQQRLLMALRDRPATARAVLARLHGRLLRTTRETLAAMVELRRLSPAHPPRRRWKAGPALPAGRLLAIYHAAERRFGVAWNVLAGVNLVESDFNKLRNDSIAGAQGPMQFMPATWGAYGLGGDIHQPEDAILGAANYLHASGAPASYRTALFHYNPSPLYVDAVLRYAHRIASGTGAFLSYYAWQVFVREPSGQIRRLTGPR